jgi:hypothetical protein
MYRFENSRYPLTQADSRVLGVRALSGTEDSLGARPLFPVSFFERGVVDFAVFGRWHSWRSPARGPLNGGIKRKEAICLPPSHPFSLLLSLPAKFWQVTSSEVQIHTFQRPKTLTPPILNVNGPTEILNLHNQGLFPYMGIQPAWTMVIVPAWLLSLHDQGSLLLLRYCTCLTRSHCPYGTLYLNYLV